MRSRLDKHQRSLSMLLQGSQVLSHPCHDMRHRCCPQIWLLTLIPPSTIRLHIRKAKSDPFGNGIFIFLGKTGCHLCPVSAVLNYMARRPQGEGPLLRWGDRSPLRQDRFVQAVKAILRDAGFDPSHYSGHSFRIGAASSAAARGIPDHLIKTLGRWRSEAYQLYVRTPPSTLAAMSSRLVVGGQGHTLP